MPSPSGLAPRRPRSTVAIAPRPSGRGATATVRRPTAAAAGEPAVRVLRSRRRRSPLGAEVSHQTLDVPSGAWAIEEEAGNYTSWRYAVAYECGARCAGRAVVAAHDEHAGAARHDAQGPPRAHRVHVALRECRRAPLLPWPAACGECPRPRRRRARAAGADARLSPSESWDTWWVVRGAAGGAARVRARASASCGALRVLSGGCAGEMVARLQRTMRMLADDADVSAARFRPVR